MDTIASFTFVKRGRLLLAFVVASFILVDAEAVPTLATKQQVGMFLNSKTCIVKDDGMNFYNAPIKEAVEKYWKITGYEFIDQTEFNKRKNDPKYSFLVMMDGAYDKDPGGVRYRYLTLVLGDGSGNLTNMPELCSIPLSYSGDNDTEFEYIIPVVIKFMQLHVRNLEKDRLPISINGLRYYNKTGFTDKLIVFNSDKMAEAFNTPEKIATVCSNKVKLVAAADMVKELAAAKSGTLFHFHVGPLPEAPAGRCYEMLFDSDGNLWYYNFRKVTNGNPDGFNASDFNSIK